MNKQELIKKITAKREFSELLKGDVELAFEKFSKDTYCDEEKIKLTRDLLRKVFSDFASKKILSLKDKTPEWILRKHLSTRERIGSYKKTYRRILGNLSKKLSVIDLGSGVNGFSYKYFEKIGYEIDYNAVEGMGQLVKLMNYYFKKEKISGRANHLSLFDLSKLKKLIKKQKKPRVVFLFKTIDSLEMLEKDYSKKLILEFVPLADKVVVSFATESMIKRRKFKVNRKWVLDFLKSNFNILDDFELSGERYLVFSKTKDL